MRLYGAIQKVEPQDDGTVRVHGIATSEAVDEQGEIVLGTKGKQKGKPLADAALRDTENVPLSEEVDAYFRREVLPHSRLMLPSLTACIRVATLTG